MVILRKLIGSMGLQHLYVKNGGSGFSVCWWYKNKRERVCKVT